jgi:hypothetical protein
MTDKMTSPIVERRDQLSQHYFARSDFDENN